MKNLIKTVAFLLSLLLSLSISCQEQNNWNWLVQAATGAHGIASDVATALYLSTTPDDYGKASPGLRADLTLLAAHSLKGSVYAVGGLGIGFSKYQIKDAHFKNYWITLDTLRNVNVFDSTHQNTSFSYLEAILPLGIGIHLGKQQRMSVLIGGLLSYRFANFSTQLKERTQFGLVNFTVESGTILPSFMVLPTPIKSRSQQDIPPTTNRFQLGAQCKLLYNLSASQHKGTSIGLSGTWFPANNEIATGHSMTGFLQAVLWYGLE
ncbi:MAG: hypothetical protein DA408_21205 [Bacteroidetes bacterium]|nr:MAG: hypothetical protein DA408_21205 [Bacteroidota bacterium]